MKYETSDWEFSETELTQKRMHQPGEYSDAEWEPVGVFTRIEETEISKEGGYACETRTLQKTYVLWRRRKVQT